MAPIPATASASSACLTEEDFVRIKTEFLDELSSEDEQGIEGAAIRQRQQQQRQQPAAAAAASSRGQEGPHRPVREHRPGGTGPLMIAW